MDDELAITKAAEIPQVVLDVIHSTRGSIDFIAGTLELEFPDLVMSRKALREAIRIGVQEDEHDQVAMNPTSLDPIMGTLDRALGKEIKRIAERIEILSDIAAEPPNRVCQVRGTGEELTPADAREELVALRGTVLEMKKQFVEQKKAENAAGHGVNVSVDLGGVVSAALENVRKMELPVEAREINAK